MFPSPHQHLKVPVAPSTPFPSPRSPPNAHSCEDVSYKSIWGQASCAPSPGGKGEEGKGPGGSGGVRNPDFLGEASPWGARPPGLEGSSCPRSSVHSPNGIAGSLSPRREARGLDTWRRDVNSSPVNRNRQQSGRGQEWRPLSGAFQGEPGLAGGAWRSVFGPQPVNLCCPLGPFHRGSR